MREKGENEGEGGRATSRHRKVTKVGGNNGKGEKFKVKKKAEWEKGKLARERGYGMREGKTARERENIMGGENGIGERERNERRKLIQEMGKVTTREKETAWKGERL